MITRSISEVPLARYALRLSWFMLVAVAQMKGYYILGAIVDAFTADFEEVWVL